MKFVISRSELSDLIKKIQNVVPQNPPMPILSHFLVEADGDELVFTASDLTVGASCRVKAKVLERGALSIPSKRFCQLIRELTDTQIEVFSDESTMVEIQAGSSIFRLHGMDKEGYPALPDLNEAIRFSVESSVLKECLYRTCFAVAKDDSRYALTGILMRIEPEKATFVGTDGKRLAKTEMPLSTTSEATGDYVLPLKAVDEIMKILGEEETATVYLTEDKVGVESGSSLLITKLIADDYPDFTQIANSNSEVEVSLHREELMTLLRQISLFADEEARSVRFSFTPGELILTANTAEVGEGTVSMPINFSSESIEIAFNPHYFQDILRHTRDETLQIGISDPFSPGVLTDSTDSLFILMPMRLNHDA
ncbi:MAG: DNA polymerase III subunit beta [Chlamydiae bacterium]|nr:DNA polymerase III subunit beta [Chlamydiota bacterium]